MDADRVAKLDRGLRAALRAFEETRAGVEPDAAISLTIRYEGDLAAIEALGFETHATWGNEAMGVVRFADIPTLAEHPAVLWMSAGRRREADVHFALPDVRVRASSAANVGTDGVWFLPATGNALTSIAKGTGKGVVVAIIDTGIDFTHPMFLSQLTPDRKTRVKFIWDQGLKPTNVNQCPDVAKLLSKTTYGVEFDDKKIEAALKGTTPIAHKDCDGHGTHVAGIAAGGQFAPGTPRHVGVAPEADIIVVKHLDVVTPIKFRNPDNSEGADVTDDVSFKDAIIWCLNTAKKLNQPVVINISIGTPGLPGDALDSESVFVDEVFGAAAPASPGTPHFPKGAVIVKSSGNNGNPGQGAKVDFAADGQAVVRLKLTDTRGGLKTKWRLCKDDVFTPSITVTFWYRRNFDKVKFAMRLPNQASFSSDVGVGNSVVRGFVPKAGPPPSVSIVLPSSSVHRASLTHNDEGAVTHPNGTSIHRHSVEFDVFPKESGGTVTYHEGIYEVRITAPKGTEVFVMCERQGWAAGKLVFFEVVSGATITPEFTSTYSMGRNVITVSAYDDADGTTGHPDFHKIAPFSSRGPLRNFGDPKSPSPPPVVAAKPEISAPGVKVSSARGADTNILPALKIPSWVAGERFMEKNGTSMATPVVTGIVALLLGKKADLTVADVRKHLEKGARTGANPSSGAAHTNAFGKGMAGALESHKDV